MEMFGCGITALDTLSGMLGIGAHCGSCRCWKVIASRVGMAQQKVADELQKRNLQNEIKAMQEKGIQPVLDGERWIWPLTIMYDMGLAETCCWQTLQQQIWPWFSCCGLHQ